MATTLSLLKVNILYLFKKHNIMAKDKSTSPRIAKIASKELRTPSTPKSVKAVAGSALSQKTRKK